MMKPPLIFFSVLALLAAPACSTIRSRVAENRAEVETWPAGVQQKVGAGEIEPGYTPTQVSVALGEPDATLTRTSADGTADVWVYYDHGPTFGFGLGVGASRGSAGYGGGVGMDAGAGGGPIHAKEVRRVVFERGVVSAVELPGK